MNDAEETTCFRNKLQIFGEGLWLFSRPQSWLGVKYHVSMYFKLSKGLFGILTATSSVSLNDMFGRKGESDLFSDSPECTTDWTVGNLWQGNNWLVNTHWSAWSACSVIIQLPHLFYFCCSYNKGLSLEIHWRRANPSHFGTLLALSDNSSPVQNCLDLIFLPESDSDGQPPMPWNLNA